MEDILKLAAVAVITALCATVVRKTAPEVSMVLVLAAGVLILVTALSTMEDVVAVMNDLSETAGLSPALLSPVLKTAGIAILTHISSAVCRDAKESGLAAFLEVAGSALALLVALPLLQTVLTMIMGLL